MGFVVALQISKTDPSPKREMPTMILFNVVFALRVRALSGCWGSGRQALGGWDTGWRPGHQWAPGLDLARGLSQAGRVGQRPPCFSGEEVPAWPGKMVAGPPGRRAVGGRTLLLLVWLAAACMSVLWVGPLAGGREGAVIRQGAGAVSQQKYWSPGLLSHGVPGPAYRGPCPAVPLNPLTAAHQLLPVPGLCPPPRLHLGAAHG